MYARAFKPWMMPFRLTVLILVIGLIDSGWHPVSQGDERATDVIRSAQSGAWSAPETWNAGRVPAEGARVMIQEGHRVVYDVDSDQAIRAINVAGVLSFARDQNTRLDVGLIKIQADDEYSEIGFDCEAHLQPPDEDSPRPALEVGTPGHPINTGHSALIRLVAFEGMDPDSCPAIVCCGGRMDFHGSPLAHTWVKLGAPANAGDTTLETMDDVSDWRVGDRVILTATTRQNKAQKTFRPSVRDNTQTEERLIVAVNGQTLTLDEPLAFDHTAEGKYRGEVANLSRNITVASADPTVARGHTMYHRYSTGSISYAEFRHLGKPGVLGRYSLHFHLVGDTMRGSSVIGASIWDSGNRWITIHGTNYLVVRDCVGYRSLGHGFFLEDGTEVYNVLDHNLAVQALSTKPLPKQVLPYDKNDGAGFWWANSLNTFTRNTAAECDEYGYFFQAPKTDEFNPVLGIEQADGSQRKIDIRTLPFIRFDGNEAHCQRRHSFNLGGGVPFGEPNVAGVGPDSHHPFVIHDLKLWDVHWGIHPVSPSLVLDNLDIHHAEYGVWRPVYNNHVYRAVSFSDVPDKTHYAFVSGPPGQDSEFEPDALIDDLPPVTVITRVLTTDDGRLLVRGTTSDNGEIKRVLVNGRAAKAIDANFAQWEIVLDSPPSTGGITALAEDDAGNIEPRPHEVRVR